MGLAGRPALAAHMPHACMLQRRQGLDCIGLTSCEDWRRQGSFPVATADAAGVQWSPSGSCLAVHDSPLAYLVGLCAVWPVALAMVCCHGECICRHLLHSCYGIRMRISAWLSRFMPAICVNPLCKAAVCREVALYDTQGRALAQFSPYEEALGVRSIAWHPSGRLLAVGSCDMVSLRWLCCRMLTRASQPARLLP